MVKGEIRSKEKMVVFGLWSFGIGNGINLKI